MKIWLTILGSGLITFLTRFSFIYLHSKTEFPAWFRRSLHYVPAAVLAAIVVPGIVARQDVVNLSFENPRLLAGIIAGLIAWKTGNVLATIGVGMAALWLLQIWL